LKQRLITSTQLRSYRDARETAYWWHIRNGGASESKILQGFLEPGKSLK
jgi:hypothetical protein